MTGGGGLWGGSGVGVPLSSSFRWGVMRVAVSLLTVWVQVNHNRHISKQPPRSL